MGRKKVPLPHLTPSVLPKDIPRPKVFQPAGGNECIRVRFNMVDVRGPWCITQIAAEHFADLLQRLNSFETMTCNKVFAPQRNEGKIYSVADLKNKDARERLVELQLDDQNGDREAADQWQLTPVADSAGPPGVR